jgi:hypothetical protein
MAFSNTHLVGSDKFRTLLTQFNNVLDIIADVESRRLVANSSVPLMASTLFTHGSIRSLGANASLTIVPAQGFGTMIVPLSIIVEANTISGAYGDTSGMDLAVMYQGTTQQANQPILYFSSAPMLSVADVTIMTLAWPQSDAQPMPIAQFNDKAMTLRLSNNPNTNLTGGHVDNRMRVNFTYTVFQLDSVDVIA